VVIVIQVYSLVIYLALISGLLHVFLHLYSIHFVYHQRALADSYVGCVSGSAIASVAALSGDGLGVLELSSSIRIWSIFAVTIQSLKIRTHC